jgi:hypothetical protein
MKKYIILTTLLLSACGEEKQTLDCKNSPLIGLWNVGGDQIAFTPSCTFTSMDCESSGTFTKTNQPNVIAVNVIKPGIASYCLSAGPHTCTYTLENNDLDWMCE